LPLLFLASLLLAACGIPISAADLALTPETTSTPEEVAVSQFAVSSRGLVTPTDPSVRALATGPLLTPQPSLTPLKATTATTGTVGPGGTTTSTVTPVSTPTPPGTPAPTSTPSPSSADLVTEALNILNKYRTDSGRPPLRADPSLMAAAANYARLMSDNNWFYCGCDFHSGPDGSQPDQRAYRAGYQGRWKGEAIAGGQGSAQGAISTWLNSPPHAAIVLDSNAVDVGIGYYYNPNDFYHHYWVLTTGTP
jgi:uncharacterized protein YkwD